MPKRKYDFFGSIRLKTTTTGLEHDYYILTFYSRSRKKPCVAFPALFQHSLSVLLLLKQRVPDFYRFAGRTHRVNRQSYTRITSSCLEGSTNNALNNHFPPPYNKFTFKYFRSFPTLYIIITGPAEQTIPTHT